MTTDGILVDQIKKEFGLLSFHPDGTLNRGHLAAVFSNAGQLARLNQLVHPRVAEDYRRWSEHQQSAYVLKEAALLFETKSFRLLDKIIVVYAPEALRLQRVLQRDKHRNRQQIDDIMKNQLSDEEKLKQADFVIRNDETQLVIPQVLALHEVFLTMAKPIHN
jgi:dephospho-CoA kinase